MSRRVAADTRRSRIEMIVGQAESDPRTDLVEPARRETVVDLYARDIVDQIARRDDPADPPRNHALLERHGAYGHGAVTHARERGRVVEPGVVEENSFEPRAVQEPQVPLRGRSTRLLPTRPRLLPIPTGAMGC